MTMMIKHREIVWTVEDHGGENIVVTALYERAKIRAVCEVAKHLLLTRDRFQVMAEVKKTVIDGINKHVTLQKEGKDPGSLTHTGAPYTLKA